MSVKTPYIIITCLLLHISVQGQSGLDCSGQMFRVVEYQNSTRLESVSIDDQQQMNTNTLAEYADIQLNALAYHPSHRKLYALEISNGYTLCSIDEQYKLNKIKHIELPQTHLFVSGDISPDERYLVVLGYSVNKASSLLAKVDLLSDNYDVEIYNLKTTDDQRKKVYCADIAYHPTTGEMYGYDHYSNRLIRIDLDKVLVDNTSFPETSIQGVMPSLFFLDSGQLMGIGTKDEDSNDIRRLYAIDIETGLLEERMNLSYEGNQDACSCPYKLALYNQIVKREYTNCEVSEFKLELLNRSGKHQTGLTFKQVFPDQTQIIDVSTLPFPAKIVQSKGDNLLLIEDIDLAIGRYEFSIRIQHEVSMPIGEIQNQASLGGLSFDGLEDQVIYSDDPTTIAVNDPTVYTVSTANTTILTHEKTYCSGTVLELESTVDYGDAFLWNTGNPNRTIEIQEAGVYTVDISTPCGVVKEEFIVLEEEIQVSLGQASSIEVEEGSSLLLKPIVQSDSPVTTYHWKKDKETIIACTYCDQLRVTPEDAAMYSVQVENASGCTAIATRSIDLFQFKVYIPNVFTPNMDEENDVFYIQGKEDYKLNSLHIYDRWGNEVFQTNNGQVNDKAFGWDGQFKAQKALPDVYQYIARVTMNSGKTKIESGSVQLIR